MTIFGLLVIVLWLAIFFANDLKNKIGLEAKNLKTDGNNSISNDYIKQSNEAKNFSTFSIAAEALSVRHYIESP